MSEFAGRVAMVTGGASGIGAAVCRALVARGTRVVVADLRHDDGEALAGELGENCRFFSLNVTDEESWIAAVDFARSWTGRIDVLVTCAGIVIFSPVTETRLADFERVIEVNLVGTFLGIKHAGRAMKDQRSGSIVTISSTSGLEASESQSAYCASKWGVRGLTKVAAIELGQHGVRVNSVHPGPVDTPMLNPGAKAREELTRLSIVRRMPLARVADPSEIASVCAFLASDASSFMNGAELAVDGGATVGMYHRGRPGSPEAAQRA